jgi:hypothetical protein
MIDLEELVHTDAMQLPQFCMMSHIAKARVKKKSRPGKKRVSIDRVLAELLKFECNHIHGYVVY